MEKVPLKVSVIIADLKAGMTREKIGEKYGLAKSDVTRLFKHPTLKGLKVGRADGFTLEDDVSNEGQLQAEATLIQEVPKEEKGAEQISEEDGGIKLSDDFFRE